VWNRPPTRLLAQGLSPRERFEQKLQLGSVSVIQIRIGGESGIAVTIKDGVEPCKKCLERRRVRSSLDSHDFGCG